MFLSWFDLAHHDPEPSVEGSGVQSEIAPGFHFDRLLCGCQAHYIRGLFFSYDSFTSRPKRDLLLCVARHRAVTLTRNAPLSKAQSPGISVSRIEPFREFPLPVLPVVESFPGAMSPLGSKEPNEPFLSPH